jgi:hypothetical protein
MMLDKLLQAALTGKWRALNVTRCLIHGDCIGSASAFVGLTLYDRTVPTGVAACERPPMYRPRHSEFRRLSLSNRRHSSAFPDTDLAASLCLPTAECARGQRWKIGR